jgi:hypothetical protein
LIAVTAAILPAPTLLRAVQAVISMTETGNEDERDRDYDSAYELLSGYHEVDGRGLPHKRYFEYGSEGDIAGRKAIARLLRADEPLDPTFRHVLANLFDPDPANVLNRSRNPIEAAAAEGLAIGRVIKIALRSQSRPRNPAAELEIMHHLSCSVFRNRLSPTDAVKEACKKFNLDQRRMWAIWTKVKTDQNSWAKLVSEMASDPDAISGGRWRRS